MKKLAFALVFVFCATTAAYAAPAKGYLNASEIYNLLDKYINGVSLTEALDTFGEPADTSQGKYRWLFDEYAILMAFDYNSKQKTLSKPTISTSYPSRLERKTQYDMLLDEFSKLFGRKPDLIEANGFGWRINASRAFAAAMEGNDRVFMIRFVMGDTKDRSNRRKK